MEKYRTHLIIIGFAVLHCLTALLCRAVGVQDEMILTLLTMVMVALVCFYRRCSIEFTAVAIVLANIVGYAIGVTLQTLLGFISPTLAGSAPLSTLIVTLLMGYFVLGCSMFRKAPPQTQKKQSDLMWALTAIVLVFFTRLTVLLLFNENDFMAYFLASIVALLIVLFIFLVSYVIIERRNIAKEKEKRHLAQFRYMRLSQQVNPHFLFNSLNILDGLVGEGQNELASTYIHKLAALYRYMLKNEDETLVKLRDELDFVEKYLDLLKVRFQEGLIVDSEVEPAALQKSVVPCSMQLLIENATKHNAIVADNPLRIMISADGESVRISNNLCPKMTEPVSTGLGLKYIRQQYQDLSGKDITIIKTDTDYTVVLPLI